MVCHFLYILYSWQHTLYCCFHNYYSFIWQQLMTEAAQPGVGLLATGMVQRSLGMRALEWHKSTKITDNEGVEVA